MPKRELMTWTRQGRWQKRYRSSLYGVSPRQLKCPPTKEASRLAANAWWEQKKAELDQEQSSTEELDKEHLSLEADIADVLKENPSQNTQFAFGRVYERRSQRSEKRVKGGTISNHVGAFLRGKLTEVDAKEITPSRYDAYRRHVEHFRDWIGGDKGIDAIDAPTMQGYLDHLREQIGKRDRWQENSTEQKQGFSRWEAKGRLATAVQFVRYLWELGLIELPRNIGGRKYRISIDATRPASIPLETAKLLIQGNPDVSERTRLFVLLMFNTGMQQMDIANLAQAEVDWDAGRIIRKRSKTRKRHNAPEVNYQLWPETFELLKKYRSKDATRVLLNDNGKPLKEETIKKTGRGLHRVDYIRNSYRKYCDHLKIDPRPPLKLIRKTAANQLESHPSYKYYAGLFLAHAPQSVKDRFYTQPSQTEFDRAIEWLRQQFISTTTPSNVQPG